MAGEIKTEEIPVGLCSAAAPSRSDARGAPVRGDGVVCSVTGYRLSLLDPLHPRGLDGDLAEKVPTGEGAPAPRDVGHCITHPWMPEASHQDPPLRPSFLSTPLVFPQRLRVTV